MAVDQALPLPEFSVSHDDAVRDDARAQVLISEMLYDRDIVAFVNSDWFAVADDFDAEQFTGYLSGPAGAPWDIVCPTLDTYAELWVADSVDLLVGTTREQLAAELRAASRIDWIKISGDRALVHKVFDGTANGVELKRVSYYFLRRDDDRWRITGFAALQGAGADDYATGAQR